MKNINSSSAPAHEAGAFINKYLSEHSGEKILFYTSGGSAIKVLDQIDTNNLNKSVAVVMADDRFTDELSGSNYLQMTKTSFYEDAKAAGVLIIDTSPGKCLSAGELAKGLNKTIRDFHKQNQKAQVIGLFGIGHDGHTASIFPTKSENKFKTDYLQVGPYVCVNNKQGSDYPVRVTLTPTYIKRIHELVIYAEGKQEVLLSLQFAKNEWQNPGLILINHKNSSLFTDAEVMKL